MPTAIFFPLSETVEAVAQRARETGLKPYLNQHRAALLDRPLPGWIPLGVFCRDTPRKPSEQEKKS